MTGAEQARESLPVILRLLDAIAHSDISAEEREAAVGEIVALAAVLSAAEAALREAREAYDEAITALRWGWPGISGESYERPIQEVHALVSDVLARAGETEGA